MQLKHCKDVKIADFYWLSPTACLLSLNTPCIHFIHNNSLADKSK